MNTAPHDRVILLRGDSEGEIQLEQRDVVTTGFWNKGEQRWEALVTDYYPVTIRPTGWLHVPGIRARRAPCRG